jgi:hypothetical protein
MATRSPDEGCIHERNAPTVRPEPSYGIFGEIMLMCGMTPQPRLVRFVCSRCGQTIDESSEPEICRRYASSS